MNDDDFQIELCSEHLKLYFDTVDTATNGLIACNIVWQHPRDYYDIIILDITMPIMDGIQACKKISDYLNYNDASSYLHLKQKQMI